MHNKTLAELSADLTAGNYSSVELTQHFLDRIAKYEPTLNSFITVTPEYALKQAQAADAARAAGKAGVLTGIPYAHKDIYCTDGVKTTCASKMLDNFIAPYDATVTTKLHDAGMVMLGKTNMDEFAMGSSNETSYYGPVKNPWDTSKVPGGSSGGSAAAVAARLAPASTATDTGGSIRQPASFCNLTGLKPTYGRVSRWGMIAFASSLDQAGMLTQTAEDTALMLEAIAGFDPKDSTSLDIAVPRYTDSLNNSLKGLKIGLPKEFFTKDLDSAVADKIDAAAKAFEKLGASLHEISLPNVGLSIPAYYVVAPAECSSNLSRYDGVRFGYRCENPVNLEDLYTRSRGEGFGVEVKRRILVGTYMLSAESYEAFYLQAQKIRHLIRDDFTHAYDSVDLILSPTAPNVAFGLGEKASDPISMYLSDLYTAATNLAGMPGMSIPAGFITDLPIGLQLTGNYFTEDLLLNAAHQYQQVTDWHQRIPK
ncbi:MAG: Asp-tRNA(Asn)/Glu-tRNA(Gln) amidotransferase subunit GatA, partial [Gammaproteobacteria bacterium]|nr:Asp-tRNA(Asn)/Glu-tRNA(Gln) amidotransferase subunit GatA [Gammaproteobacteria bacterium]